MTTITIIKETKAGEFRVAASVDAVKKYTALGAKVQMVADLADEDGNEIARMERSINFKENFASHDFLSFEEGTGGDENNGTRWAHFRGPDGNIYEFVHHPSIATGGKPE